MDQKFCPACKLPIFESYLFCPNCGVNLKEAGAPTLGKQISVYLVSILLPPLGLFPAIRYIRRDDSISKRVGFVALILTIISTAVTIWFTLGFINTVNKTLNQQINIQQLGY